MPQHSSHVAANIVLQYWFVQRLMGISPHSPKQVGQLHKPAMAPAGTVCRHQPCWKKALEKTDFVDLYRREDRYNQDLLRNVRVPLPGFLYKRGVGESLSPGAAAPPCLTRYLHSPLATVTDFLAALNLSSGCPQCSSTDLRSVATSVALSSHHQPRYSTVSAVADSRNIT
jgi:hypothetical protein